MDPSESAHGRDMVKERKEREWVSWATYMLEFLY